MAKKLKEVVEGDETASSDCWVDQRHQEDYLTSLITSSPQ